MSTVKTWDGYPIPEGAVGYSAAQANLAALFYARHGDDLVFCVAGMDQASGCAVHRWEKSLVARQNTVWFPAEPTPQRSDRPDVIGQIVNTVNGDAYDVTTHELRQGDHICVRAIDGQEWSYVGEDFVFRPNHIAAHEFLERGVKHMRDRAVQRDSDAGERSMARAVAAFNAQEGTNLTEAQGWRFMIQLKYARAVNGVFVADDYDDMAAYAGLAGEAAQ